MVGDMLYLLMLWDGEVRFASDYFDQLYEWAKYLVSAGKAYICELNSEQIREFRGTLTAPGKNSPYRNRSPQESMEMLEHMKLGEVDEGTMTLRAKIDMSSPNINLRDPVMYRIKKNKHHRTGSNWNIYPSYDFAHGQEDAIEGITHSICTLEFASNRPLYDWFISNLPVHTEPRQYEFGRLNINYMVTSKRKLKQLVTDGYVEGWDDPRMPTLCGMRRRGVTPSAIRAFCDSLAIAKTDGVVDISQLEYFVRDDLNNHAKRAMCVMSPILLVIDNFGDKETELLRAACHPSREDLGSREIPFSSKIWIDRNDFSEDSSLSRKKFKRLVLGDYVRLRAAYVLRADSVEKDSNGVIIQIHGSIVRGTIGQPPPDGVKPRGVIHWVSQKHAIDCTIHQYDRLFEKAIPDEGDSDFTDHINPHSLQVLNNCKAEPSLADASYGESYQFEREGYYCLDGKMSGESDLVFNCTIGLRENWRKQN